MKKELWLLPLKDKEAGIWNHHFWQNAYPLKHKIHHNSLRILYHQDRNNGLTNNKSNSCINYRTVPNSLQILTLNSHNSSTRELLLLPFLQRRMLGPNKLIAQGLTAGKGQNYRLKLRHVWSQNIISQGCLPPFLTIKFKTHMCVRTHTHISYLGLGKRGCVRRRNS